MILVSEFFLYSSTPWLLHLLSLVTMLCVTAELWTNSETQTTARATSSESDVFLFHFTFMTLHVQGVTVPSPSPGLPPLRNVYMCSVQSKHMAVNACSVDALILHFTCLQCIESTWSHSIFCLVLPWRWVHCAVTWAPLTCLRNVTQWCKKHF